MLQITDIQINRKQVIINFGNTSIICDVYDNFFKDMQKSWGFNLDIKEI